MWDSCNLVLDVGDGPLDALDVEDGPPDAPDVGDGPLDDDYVEDELDDDYVEDELDDDYNLNDLKDAIDAYINDKCLRYRRLRLDSGQRFEVRNSWWRYFCYGNCLSKPRTMAADSFPCSLCVNSRQNT